MITFNEYIIKSDKLDEREMSNSQKLKQIQYYWDDLIGRSVFNDDNLLLGAVDSLFTSGDNDILVIKNNNKRREILIPFLKTNIITIEDNKIIVRWNDEI